MSTSYIPYHPEQHQQLLPHALQDWLPPSHLAYFISDTIDILNLSAFHARYAKDGARNQPFHPLMMGQGVGLCPDLIVSYKEIGVNHLDKKRDENETKSF